MKATIVFFAILVVMLAPHAPVFAWGGNHPPEPVHPQDEWPAGLAELLNREERVHGYWVNANDFFFFAGDTDAFNEFLERYATLKNTPLRLVLHPGVGMTGSVGVGRDIPFEWRVSVEKWHSDPSKAPTLVTMELWLGGLVQLKKIEVPLSVEVKSGGEIEAFIAEHKTKRKALKPPLAELCNTVKWEIPVGSSDLFPAALREIQRELIASGKGALPEIEASLERSLNLRRIAAKVLAKWSSDKTRAILVQLIKDKDGTVASQAAFYLGEVGGKEVYKPLLDATKHADANVRHAALNALARTSGYGADAYRAAVACLDDKEYFVRESAVGLIAEVRGENLINEGIKHLRKISVSNKHERIRQAADRAIKLLEARK